ncbi:hypothetical protein ACHAWU_001532 [Discostella pseudostelligera]|uniref:Uncharacterized protein n=1 Tax=Discostella pseudostelligera TaxID=259834 RepID=A0ABD3MMI3_9STRA
MGFDGGEQHIIDEYGRCTLHPDMQLQHCTSSGEWRELLTVCPLCASGLPPTATAARGRHSRSNTPQSQQVAAAVGGDDQGELRTRTQTAVAGGECPEEMEGFIMSSRRETIGSTTASGRDKKHKSKKKHHGSSHTYTHGIDDSEPTGESRHRSTSTSRNRKDEADGKGTSKTSSKAKARRSKDGGLSSSAPELYNTSHSQAEIPLQSIPTVTDGTIEEKFNGVDTLTIYDEDVSHQHSWGEQQTTTENFQSHVPKDDQRQFMHQEVYCSEILPPTPQQMHETSTIPNSLITDPQHRMGGTPMEGNTGDASSARVEVQKRPDPKDFGELEQMQHNMNQFHIEDQLATYYPHAASPSPPTVPHSNMSPLPWNGGGRHPIQNSNPHSEYQMQSDFTNYDKPMPRIFEQDEVSVMTMSSVTQQMHTQLHIQRQQQRQADRHRQHQLEDVESDDESSSSSSTTSSTDSEYNNNSSKVPSVKSTALTSKVSSDMRSVSTKSVSSSAADRGGKINTCDYDERGWCRRHPTTVHLRKKNLFRSTWTVLLSHCPECCLDEMKRVRDVQHQSRKKGGGGGAVRSKNSYASSSGRSVGGETSGSHASSSSSRGKRNGGGNKSGHKSKERKKTSSNSKTNKNPPISQLHLRATKSTGDPSDDIRSVGTASTVTISSHTQSTGGRLQSSVNMSPGSPSGSANDIRGDYANNMIVEHSGEDNGDGSGATAHVTRMPYIDKYGSHGWYTGQVDPSTGTPHGIGTMNYANGAVCYSEWNFGMSVNPPTEIQEEPFMMGGGGGGSRSPRQPRHHHGSYRSPMGHGGRSYLATLTEDGTSSDYEYTDGPSTQQQQQQQQHHHHHQQQQQQQQQSAVVCGLSWTDENGNTGSYTGEVNFLSIPHGMGSMRYDHGNVSEGMWRNGAIVGINDSNSEKYRSSSSSPTSSSSSSNASSTSSMERERRGGGDDNYFSGSVSVGY